VHVVVVGGGAIGLLTAVECVLRGARVSVVEQAAMPNSHGTSYDWHRIVRALHPDDPEATRAAVESQAAWRALEQLLRARLFVRTGALTVVRRGTVGGALAMLGAAGATATSLDPDELEAAYPRIRVSGGLPAVLEPGAGVVLADRALSSLTGFLRLHPRARMYPRTRVTACDAEAGAVRCSDGSLLRGDRIVIAAGPWSRSLLSERLAGQLTLVRQSVLFCRPPKSCASAWQAMPAIPAFGDPGGSWLVPPVACTPLKLSAASAARPVSEVTDRETPARLRDELVEQLSESVVGLSPTWVTGARDLYYLAHATTGGSVLAREGTKAWAFAACGGTAFKFAPVIARALTERILGPALRVAA
jgi:glycine/D-amino acid oxidase-like deaminating enzyme